VPKALRHALCVLALMWTGLVNGQPFFFATDTTNYIRAADVAVYVASHHRFSTVWTDRYKGQLDPKAAGTARPAGRAPEQITAAAQMTCGRASLWADARLISARSSISAI
jgi:hypothetical protein